MKRCAFSLSRIAAASNVELSKATAEIYLERFLRLTPEELEEAVRRTIDEWTEASKMPPLSFILDRAIAPESFHPRKFSSVADIDQDRVPKGWTAEEVFRAHLTQEKIRQDARKPLPRDPKDSHLSKVSESDIQRWLEDGKRKQNEHIAKLEADPKWQEMAKQMGGKPGLSKKLPPTKVPSDPAARQKWASAMAVKQGWMEPVKEREPGEEG